MHSMQGQHCFHFASARLLITFFCAWAFSGFRILAASLLMSLTVGEMQDWQNRVPHKFDCCFCSSFYWRAGVWYHGDSLLCNILFHTWTKHFSKLLKSAAQLHYTWSGAGFPWVEERGRLSPVMTRVMRTSKQLPEALVLLLCKV